MLPTRFASAPSASLDHMYALSRNDQARDWDHNVVTKSPVVFGAIIES